jgi:GxxExxY protein
MGLSATGTEMNRRSPEIFSQGGREDGRFASENFGFTPRADLFVATQSAADRWQGVQKHDSWALSEQVIAACMDVHTELGPGLLESVYEAALCEELAIRGIPFRRQQSVGLHYKGKPLEQSYRIDLIVDSRLLVEIKAVEDLLPVHAAQVITYLRVSGVEHGLLVNFNTVSLRHGLRRLSRTPKTSRTSRPPVLPVKKSGSV